jgi:hypothetical protein
MMTPKSVRNDLNLCAIIEVIAILVASMNLYIKTGLLELCQCLLDYIKACGWNLVGREGISIGHLLNNPEQMTYDQR